MTHVRNGWIVGMGALLAVALGGVGCSSSGSTHGTTQGPSTGSGGSAGGGSGGTSGAHDGGPAGLPKVPGTPDTSVKTALPPLPALTNVTATAIDDNVSIHFDPIDGAKDYRVYVLPKDSDVSSDSSGHVTVKNATYRCGGNRQMPAATLDGAPQVQSGAIHTLVDGQDVDGVTRTLPDATLGYVYVTAGDGRVPVYAMGDPAANGDNDCYFQRWGASRSKKYVTSESDRTQLLGQRWRDDGPVFYVPASAGASTKPVYTSNSSDGISTYYYVDGPEADKRGKDTVAFQVLADAAGADTKALMRVFYENICGKSHDELAPGQAWFERVRNQGDQQPLFDLHWSGLTGETTLVVEALGDGCPYPGFLAPMSSPAKADGGFGHPMPEWLTFDQMRAASPSGEVYVNGQFDTTDAPRPIARSFVKISPGPKPELDWFESFGPDTQTTPLTEEPCGIDNCFAQFRRAAPFGDVAFMAVDDVRWGLTNLLGELWVAYDDRGADTNGKFRLTPGVKASMAADSFVHATMTVDAFTTGRRYPQILISDQDAPVQNNMVNGNTILVETFMNWPNTYQVEVCDHQMWDVNAQCRGFDTYHLLDPNDPTKTVGLAPSPEVGEHIGVDRSMIFDVYASTKRVYLFLDQEPYGCVNLPAAGVPSGAVTVTFGDVLYHSDVDVLFDFHSRHQHREDRRHFDNLGFKSGVAEPGWDESRFPCASHMQDF